MNKEEKVKDTTINIEETIQTINKQNKRIEELCLEIERLNNIIKEVREYIESYMPNYDFDKTNLIKLLEILQGSNENG